LKKPAESIVYVELYKVHIAKLCYYFDSGGMIYFVRSLEIICCNPELHNSQEILLEFNDIGLYQETQLKGIKFGHLDWKEMSLANAHPA
jgi:hypothetical protein